jgi:uncharacterized protein
MSPQSETVRPESRWWKVIRFPLTRMALAILFVGVAIGVAQFIIGLLGTAFSLQSSPVAIVSILIASLAVLGAYWAYVRWVEQRPVTELSGAGALREFSIGALVGLGLFAIIVAILWLLGYYQVTGVHSWSVLTLALVANVPSGLIQEILFRGVIFRITEEALGTWLALAISAVLFGLAHILMAQATVFSTLSIMLEAGILMGAAYMLTRRLWLVIGIHIAWDVANDGIFGVGASGISGTPIQGLLQAKLTGPAVLSGGAIGVEASLVAVLILVAAGVYLAWRAQQKGHVVSPFWQKASDV